MGAWTHNGLVDTIDIRLAEYRKISVVGCREDAARENVDVNSASPKDSGILFYLPVE
jgi:hypothetical protein